MPEWAYCASQEQMLLARHASHVRIWENLGNSLVQELRIKLAPSGDGKEERTFRPPLATAGLFVPVI